MRLGEEGEYRVTIGGNAIRNEILPYEMRHPNTLCTTPCMHQHQSTRHTTATAPQTNAAPKRATRNTVNVRVLCCGAHRATLLRITLGRPGRAKRNTNAHHRESYSTECCLARTTHVRSLLVGGPGGEGGAEGKGGGGGGEGVRYVPGHRGQATPCV